MNPGERLLICGASARAAAASALRAGLQPFAIDLFGDADLVAMCPCLRILPEEYPHGFIELARRAPPGPWMYTGGLENYPDVVDAISRDRPLWGNDGEVLRAVRDPFRLAQQLHAANLHFPEVLLAGSRVPTDGSWLVKPLAGSGGSGIAIWRGQRLTSRAANGHYFQKPIEGEPHSAVYFGDGQTASLLGVTRQLVGEPWLHAKPFAYCGSIGPALLSACTDDQLLRLGVVLARAFNLRGLFGVDFVLHEQDSWLVEVNPRYTASVEVLELSLEGTFIHLVAEHFGRGALCIEFIPAWGKLTLQSREPSAPPQWRFVVKAVYFAKQDALYNVEPSELQQGCLDVPRVGTQILAGHPVLSLIEVGSSVEDCLEKLTYVAAWLDWRLYSR